VDDGADGQKPGKKAPRKGPRKLSPRYLENAVLHYLQRYAATEAGVRRVLLRKVDRALKFHGGDRQEALGWVDALVEKLVRGGLLNDAAFAEMKAQSLRASGRSARVIALKLRQKGVPAELVTQTLAGATQEVSEEQAALKWARKKRLGPYRPTDEARRDHRQKDLAALARAGFDFHTARKVIEGPVEPSTGPDS
jgi:regulatory protein